MRCANPTHLRAFSALVAFAAVYMAGNLEVALGQEPPLTIPNGGPPPAGPNAIPFDGWQLYPSFDTFTQYSNNYFLSPLDKISGWSFGVSPKMTAEWSNGIHTTTLFGTFTHIDYPTNNEVNTNDGEATITQQYAPVRDLNFTFLGDYTHQTIAPSLTSGIPSPISSTATSVLPNGNTVLPNGTIVTPSGQTIGQTSPVLGVSGLSIVDPYDAFTATGKVQKLFGDGIATIGASLLRQDYDELAAQSRNFTAKTFTEDASFWLGPVLYVYSDGAFTMNDNTNPSPNSDVYRAIGGIGTRQIAFYRASAYFGHQGSQSSGFPWAGGNVYGGALTYYPTPIWTINANHDVTINLAPPGLSPSTLALSLPVITPLQIPLSSSTQISTSSVQSVYKITPLWTANVLFGYSAADYLGTPNWEKALFGVAILKYQIRQALTLTWQYQYADITSNLPLTSGSRNFVAMSASYKF